jgi:uncharacterized protein YqhQ
MAETKPFNYGGQAVIEGVMMRGRNNLAVAVRRPDGEIDVVGRPLAKIYKGRFREMPFIRGIIVLIETLVLGIQSLFHSAQVAAAEEEGQEISPKLLWGTLAMGIIFATGIFFVLPLLVTHYLIYPFVSSAILGNIFEGVLRIGIFILYLVLVGLMPDIRAVFAYHGAEHKTVNAYEAGVPMEVEQVKNYSTAHTRCGTSFLLVVMVLAILVFTLLGRPPLWLAILSRIVLIPAIAAIGYEYIRFAAAHGGNLIVRSLIAPGIALQSMTTREPNERQLEIAISALKNVVEADSSEDEPSDNNSQVAGIED